MKEKELRVALVCFGGVSLAIYMHGISKEIVKLIRASAALHAIGDRDARLDAELPEADRRNGECDTEPVYFHLLREIGRHVDLRVVVDIIAGASAGGINGTMLACALAHDLPVGRLRDLWLENADIATLLAPEARAGRWSKAVLKPLFWGAGATGLLPSMADAEVRGNLSLFVRSRWFKPPLDGLRMAGLMYDALSAIHAGGPAQPGSLLPNGHQLDLFVTLTDFHGHSQQVQIHDPPLIYEHEHRHVLHFRYRRNQSGVIDSDFRAGNIAELTFAARATSSYPGIFPAAQIAETDRLLAERGLEWPGRQAFIDRAFSSYIEAGIDVTHTSFIDGSVLNNRPFREAIAAIHGRPAYRQVDRRLLYIDPNPAAPPTGIRRAQPGLFSMLKGAVSDLPRNQPVSDELDWVTGFNDRVRQLRAIIEDARPRVTQLVAEIVAAPLDWAVAAKEIRAWRHSINARVAHDAGFAYEGYVRLKLTTVLASVSHLIADLRGVEAGSPLGRVIAATVEAWARQNGITYTESGHAAANGERPPTPRWVRFLDAFDADYRKRRLHFLIEGQNRLYQLMGEGRFEGLESGQVDRLKRDFYACFDTLERRRNAAAESPVLRAAAIEIFPEQPSAADVRGLATFTKALARRNNRELGRLMDRLAASTGLASSTHETDLILAALDPTEWQREARREILVNYLGFPYWDVLTLPVTTARRTGELHEILVDRISSLDAHTLAGFNGPQSLKGIGFGNFAGFLSRAYRENDYLLGRLHAIDRLIDIVCDAAGMTADGGAHGIDVLALKKQAFAAVLEAEKEHLPESGALMDALRGAVAAL